MTKGQQHTSKGTTTFELFQLPYMYDDGSILFESKQDMAKGTTLLLYHHMKRFGLIMHIGRQDGSKSKTETLYIPPPFQQ
jgi:hypothetical protein